MDLTNQDAIVIGGVSGLGAGIASGKRGVVGMTRPMARDLAPHGVQRSDDGELDDLVGAWIDRNTVAVDRCRRTFEGIATMPNEIWRECRSPCKP